MAVQGGTSTDGETREEVINNFVIKPIDDPDILSSTLLDFTDRYFTQYYAIDVKGREGWDQCVLQHSNKLCVVCLAPSHPLCREKEISKIDFQISKSVSRLDNCPSGKFKNEFCEFVHFFIVFFGRSLNAIIFCS